MRKQSVVFELGLVFGESHFFEVPVEFARLSAIKGKLGLLLVIYVELHQLRTGFGSWTRT